MNLNVTAKVIPNKLIYKNEVYEITSVDSKFVLRGFKIHLEDNGTLKRVTLSDYHPNCDPYSKEFCIPPSLIHEKLENKTMLLIMNYLKTFNFDSCYYMPWVSFKYKKKGE